jgi:hypothetical protein
MTTRNIIRAFALGVLFSFALAAVFVSVVKGMPTPTRTPKATSPVPSESPSAARSGTPPPSVSRFFDPQTGNYWSYSNGQWWSYSYSTENAIRALELAGWSAERRIHYSDALEHLREAQKLTDQRRDPEEWARIQNGIMRVIFQQRHYGNVGGVPDYHVTICEGVKIDTVGTGETIGHVADLRLENVTDQPINCVVPPMVLESKSGKNQDYVCPKGETLKIDPHGTATVPMDGVCVKRNKPPVGKGVTGDLVVNTGDSTVPQNPGSHVPAKQARDLLRLCTSKYDAADKLQKDGALKDLPYKDKQKQKDIVVQWSTWSDPQVCAIVGTPAATKDDLKKVVYKQVEEKGPMTPATKKKVDQGIDTIFEKVELTTAKAKDVEKPEQAHHL